MGCRWKRLGQAEFDLPLLILLATQGCQKRGKTTLKPYFELSEPLFGPGIGSWGVVGSLLARPN